MSPTPLEALVSAISACRICRDRPAGPALPHEPRPVLQVGQGRARVFVCGQAPGTRVHASGRPFTDPSGDRLRDWMGIDPAAFYDADRLAIIPMGFCFPGLDARGADLPPRPECAKAWHDALFSALPRPRLVICVGLHAIGYHLRRLGRPELVAPTLTQTVSQWQAVHEATGVMPLPHPSWRNSGWLKRNPWFDAELVPVLRRRVAEAL